MEYFQDKFFPDVWAAEYGPNKFVTTSPYCKFDSQTLQLFQSSLYIAGFFASFVASYIAKLKGRKICMIISGVCYLIGAGLTTGAVPRQAGLSMLIIGRIMLGVGVGFANSSVTIYSSEMAPSQYRGALNLLFQWCTTIGIIIAQLINYGTVELYEYGWRISLAIAAVPALMILFGGIFLPESPSSLISRNYHDEGRKVLQQIRGQEDVEMEFQDIVMQTREANAIKHPLKALFKPCYRPQLVISTTIAIVQQLTGINAIMFYAPQVFSTFGSGRKAALLNTVIIGAVNVIATLVAIVGVDRVGRRFLFIASGICMVACEVIVGVCLGYYFGHNNGTLPDNVSNGVLAVICFYVANFAWSWGPLGWLVPAEIQPAEIRTAGMSLATSMNMLFTFVIGQCFLTMLCSMRYGVFLFFAACCTVGTLFIYFLLPECKGLHVEEVYEVFQKHWFWKRYPAPNRPESLDDGLKDIPIKTVT
jgi:sugar porter (SP) family MFS transporter